MVTNSDSVADAQRKFDKEDSYFQSIPDLASQLKATHARIGPHVRGTPVFSSTTLNKLLGCEIFFKCENFQLGGSYKLRGALNASLQLSAAERAKGVVTHSSGNFAAAVAIASKQLEIPNYIVVPAGAARVKVDAARAYGGNVIECGPTLADRVATTERIQRETGAAFLHPSNDWNVILGQGTAALELLTEVGSLDACFCPVGGGGIVAGSCLAMLCHNASQQSQVQGGTVDRRPSSPGVVIGGEPLEADDAFRSLLSGRIETNTTTNTIADGLRSQLGHINFPIIKDHVQQIVRVTEIEILNAMELIWTRLKIVAEPSSAVGLAALQKLTATFQGRRVGVIITGGNICFNQIVDDISSVTRES